MGILFWSCSWKNYHIQNHLCNKLDLATCLCNLSLGLLADIPGSNDDWDFRNSALAQNLGVAECQQVKYRSSILLRAGDVFVTRLLWDQGPKLLEVDGWFPELVLSLVEAA